MLQQCIENMKVSFPLPLLNQPSLLKHVSRGIVANDLIPGPSLQIQSHVFTESGTIVIPACFSVTEGTEQGMAIHNLAGS